MSSYESAGGAGIVTGVILALTGFSTATIAVGVVAVVAGVILTFAAYRLGRRHRKNSNDM